MRWGEDAKLDGRVGVAVDGEVVRGGGGSKMGLSHNGIPPAGLLPSRVVKQLEIQTCKQVPARK